MPQLRSSMESSPSRQGMQRQGTHIYSLPSAARRNRGESTSTVDSSVVSALSQSPELPPIPLSSSSRSSLADSSAHEHRSGHWQDWSLLSIVRVDKLSGMILVALYHIPSSTLYTWPMQTDPKAAQPKQGTVFIAPIKAETGASSNAAVTSESLKVLTTVLLTWMRHGSKRSQTRARLGEREEDTDWLRKSLKMSNIPAEEKDSILEKQVIRPLKEWSSQTPSNSPPRSAVPTIASTPSEAEISASSSKDKGKQRILAALHINDARRSQSYGASLSPTSGLEKVPSIEISSPNTSDVLSRHQAPWLQPNNKASYIH